MPPRLSRSRSIPPRNVSTVFYQGHLPTSCTVLFQWAPMTWYLGDAVPEDMLLARDRIFLPFLPGSGPYTQEVTNYRLHRLDLESRALLGGPTPPEPEPLPSLPLHLPRDRPACARSYGFENSNSALAQRRRINSRRRPLPSREPSTISCKRGRLDVGIKILEKASKNKVAKLASSQTSPFRHDQSALLQCESNGVDASANAHRNVALQFLAPNEPRLMATITYSIPPNGNGKDPSSSALGIQQHFEPPSFTVQDLSVAFRSSNPPPFLNSFDSPHDPDTITKDIKDLTSQLDHHIEKSGPIRKVAEHGLRVLLGKQAEIAKLYEEECSILLRLREVEREKIAAARAEKAAPRDARAAARSKKAEGSTAQVNVQHREGSTDRPVSRRTRASVKLTNGESVEVMNGKVDAVEQD